MTNLTIHNIGDDIVSALNIRARQHGVSMEVEHRWILAAALVRATGVPLLNPFQGACGVP